MTRSGLVARLQAWLGRGGQLPTTAAGAEQAVVILIVGMRIGTLVQMAPSLPRGLEVSPQPVLYGISWLTAALTSVVVSGLAIKRGHGLGPTGAVLDLTVCVLLQVVGVVTVPVDHRMGSWVGFQSGYALSVILSVTGVRSSIVWLGGLGAILAGELIYLGDSVTSETASTVVGNLLTYLVLAIVARAALGYIRRIAADADRARALAAELARREEERRAQVAIHNGAAVMRLLADPSIDVATRDLLRDQARLEGQRIRSYLRGERPPDDMGDAHVALAAAVERTCHRFDDLPIERALDLAGHVVLPRDRAEAIQHALTSLLLNVRMHAGAQSVVVHLDADDATWMLTVHDDGQGFDPHEERFGVGLREVVRGELERRDIDVRISSHEGVGTTVTIQGTWSPSRDEEPA